MMRRLSLLLLLLALPPRSAAGQTPASDLFQEVQRRREVAERMWLESRDPRAFDTLQAALASLRTRTATQLAHGLPQLASRTANTWYDVLLYRAQAGDTAAALAALRELAAAGGGSAYLEFMRQDSTLAPLLALPDFARIAGGLRNQRRMWRDSAFVTPYRDTLPEHERIAGLSLLWAEIRYGYPDFVLSAPELNWDSLYIATIPKVQAAQSSFDYYRVLQDFVARLGDSHTNAYMSSTIYQRWGARPPLATRLIDGRVLVTDVRSSSLAALGVRAGQEVVAVDGVPVQEYAAERVRPYVSASTPQDADVRTYSYDLLRGWEQDSVSLTLRDARGRTDSLRLARSGYDDVASIPMVRDSVLPGNIGYLRIDTFGADTVVPLMRAAMARLADTDGLIVDVRYNGGGSTNIGYALLRVLAERPFPSSGQRTRYYSALSRARGSEPLFVQFPIDSIRPDTIHPHYGKPVAMLIGPMTFSAAEDFAVAFDNMERGPMIGEPTGGNTGQPLFFPLPGGGAARVRTKHDLYPEGREFLFVGVQPDILVRPRAEGIRAGRDEVLEAALGYLRENR
ncbi:MAG TPA: S41 family peptidase [Longimicrobiales bacterium]|nr:S41 family peptidase [Longimicrobiales bacterium]